MLVPHCFRHKQQSRPQRMNISIFVLILNVQRKFDKETRSTKPELRLTLGEMCGLLSCYLQARSPLLSEFHSFLQSPYPFLVGTARLVENVNRVRNPATHASIDSGQTKDLIVKCRQILNAIKGC